jgi:hypothetical protein
MKAIGPDWLNIDLPFPCEVHAHRFMNNLPPTDNYRVYVDTWEPRSSCESVETIHKHANRFDLILTLDDELAKLPNANLLVGGTPWVYPWSPPHKEFSVSFLCTSNNYLPGYEIRHILWANQHRIYALPRKFWSSRIRPVDLNRMIPLRTDGQNEKVELFHSMFSICPENTAQRNYFTEKVLDCFATKTVPVYWGCPNIGDYFDTRGMIMVDNIEDLFKKVNSITEETYQQMLPYVEDNYSRSLKYAMPDGPERLRLAILSAKEAKAAV